MRRTRNKVVWKSPAELPPEAVVPKLTPFRYSFAGEALLPDWMAAPPEAGSAFFVTKAANRLPASPGMEAPPHPYLVVSWWAAEVSYGSLAVYVGPVRLADRGGTVQHLRHSFLIGGTVYIVPDLNILAPL